MYERGGMFIPEMLHYRFCLQKSQFPLLHPLQSGHVPFFFFLIHIKTAPANHKRSNPSNIQSRNLILKEKSSYLIDQKRRQPGNHTLEHNNEKRLPSASHLTLDRSHRGHTGRI